MTQSLVLSIHVCRGLGISPLRTNIWLSFAQADLAAWPNICPGMIFFRISGKFETVFVKVCAHSERYSNLMAGIFEI